MKNIPLIITLLVLSVSCSRYPSDVERTLRFAGDNRAELERVLERYRESGEGEKYRAACFLIGNMGGRGSKDGPALRKYRVSPFRVNASRQPCAVHESIWSSVTSGMYFMMYSFTSLLDLQKSSSTLCCRSSFQL